MFVTTALKGAALSLAALAFTTPAAAALTTFASYTAVSTAENIRWQKVGTSGGSLYTISNSTGTAPSSVAVKFSFFDAALTGFGPLDASYTLLASVPNGNAAVAGNGFLVQSALSGGFSFIYTGSTPLVVGSNTYNTGANLLSATFTNASIAGPTGSSSGNASASSTSTDVSTITYTSDILDFSNVVNTGFAINLTSIRPVLSQAGANASLNSFRTSSGGSFSSEPAPVVGSVPEPTTWAMMVMGFGLAGMGLRRRTRPTTVLA